MARMNILGMPSYYEGYVNYFHQPVLNYTAAVEGNIDAVSFRQLASKVNEKFGIEVVRIGEVTPEILLDKVIAWTSALLEQNKHPVCENASYKHVGGRNPVYNVFQPCISPSVTLNLVKMLMALISEAENDVDAALEKIRQFLQGCQLNGFNPLHFVKSAHELNIPWKMLSDNVVQLGWGKNSRWLESSFTDKTSHISVRMARNKMWAADQLRKAGCPVPDHLLIREESELEAAVKKIGFPLVLKPIAEDGGRGVKANLCTNDEVIKAFHQVYSISKVLLVERHVPGKDYRLQVVKDEVIGVIERSPGGVVGNGVNSVGDLVAMQNEERRLAHDDRRHLHPIAMDEEAADQLRNQGLDWTSVPSDNVFVRLRGACNVASGGIPREIPIDKVHRDNLALAVNAARAIRLDVAGIDLLIPDISVSWLTSGAHICEINAQPQMFTTLHLPMLQSLFEKSNSRVPVMLLLSDRADIGNKVNYIACRLMEKGVLPGWVIDKNVFVGDQIITNSAPDCYSAVNMLCQNPAVEAIVFVVSEIGDIRKGWPVDHCDLIVVDNQPNMSDERRQNLVNLMHVAAMLKPLQLLLNKADKKITGLSMQYFPYADHVHYEPLHAQENKTLWIALRKLLWKIS